MLEIQNSSRLLLCLVVYRRFEKAVKQVGTPADSEDYLVDLMDCVCETIQKRLLKYWPII